MNLKAFHIVFIGTSTLLCWVFAGWCFFQGGAAYLVAGAAGVASGLGLLGYGSWFLREMRGLEER